MLCLSPHSTAKAAAGSPDDPVATTVSIDVRVVNVVATVRDKHGKIVSDLRKGDFTLEEDGHAVPVQYFSRETALPLTLGLLVDTSLSQTTVLDQEKSASKVFLQQMLRPEDVAFVLHFDREVELLQDLTSSKEKLEAALNELQTPSLHRGDDSPRSGGDPDSRDESGQGRSRGMHRSGTTLYDAIYLAANELMKKQQGRKALIVLSDGVDRGSKETLESAIEAAQRADIVVYSILFKGQEEFGNHHGFSRPSIGGPMGGPMGGGRRHGGGPRYPEEPRPDGKKILERVSKQTGGRMFEASKKEPVDQIYSAIEEELRNQYSLGFTPAKADSLGYHKLVLKTSEKDASVQARDGFYLTE
jgi:VWFA-related protein